MIESIITYLAIACVMFGALTGRGRTGVVVNVLAALLWPATVLAAIGFYVTEAL